MNNDRPRRRRRGTSNGNGNGTREETVKSEEQVRPQPTPERNSVDLNSKSATHVANIVFRRPQQYNFPVIQFDCHNCLPTCQYIRASLQAGPEELRPLVRIEDQKLDTLTHHKNGHLHVLESAAMLDGNPATPISVLSLYIPGDMHMRYFWTLMSPASLLTELTRRGLLGPAVQIPYYDNPPARSKDGHVLASRHHMLFECIAENFLKATTFPHSPEYHTASLISDVCPCITDLATARQRIETDIDLHVYSHYTSPDGKDLSDDRYIFELHEAERALASIVHACCAEYLLIKRQYFKAFSRDTVLHAEKVRRAVAHNRNQRSGCGPVTGYQDQRKESRPATRDQNQRAQSRVATPVNVADNDDKDDEGYGNSLADTPSLTPRATRSRARSSSVPVVLPAPDQSTRVSAAQIGARNRALQVRTKNAHAKAVEAQTGWSFTRSKKLVRGWQLLGFLDEERVLAVFDGGDDGGGSDEE